MFRIEIDLDTEKLSEAVDIAEAIEGVLSIQPIQSVVIVRDAGNGEVVAGDS